MTHRSPEKCPERTWRRSLVRMLVIVAVCLPLVSCNLSGRTKQAEIGMLLHFRGADQATIERQFDLMTAMNITWVRIDIDWEVTEPQQGHYEWAPTDKFVEEATARGMNVLAVLAFTPEWARLPGPDRSDDSAPARHLRPRDLSTYGDFARIATERYASRGVRSWEIWNEPNIEHFWPPHPDADEYGQLFRVAAEQIRGVDPQATVLIGGLSPKFVEPDSEIAPAAYLEQLYANGTAQLADGVAAHPYTFPSLPMDSHPRTIGGFNQLPELHQVMVRHGDAPKKVWITELGAPTGSGTNSMSVWDQAATLSQARRQVEHWDWTGPLIYYELVDGGTDPSDIAENFGVLREDLTAKPAVLAVMATVSGQGC